MATIEASHYQETRDRLAADPIVIAMASGIPAHAIAGLTHESGTPRHEFMLRANAEYRARGGTDGGHIGAIAEALLTLAG